MAAGALVLYVFAALEAPVLAGPGGRREPQGGSGPVSWCSWSEQDGALTVEWPAVSDGDYFELQISSSERPDQHFAVVATSQTLTVLGMELLKANTEYYLRVRTHWPYKGGGAPYLTNGAWGPAGPPSKCQTGTSHREVVPDVRPLAPQGEASSFSIEFLRCSEYTSEVDYLANHDSSDLHAGVAYLTEAATHKDDPDYWKTNYWFPPSFNLTTWSLYCVDILVVEVSGSTSPQGDARFVDYMGCNGAGTDECVCPKTGDRDRTMKCNQSGGCEHSAWTDRCWLNGTAPLACPDRTDFEACKCVCPPDQWVLSQAFTGMEPIYATAGGNVGGGTERLGTWYSHPEAAECPEHTDPGGLLPDGRLCSWRRHPAARVLRGKDLLELGLIPNMTFTKDNEAVFLRGIAAQPLQPWSCQDMPVATPLV